jgi:Ni,Fe-hydrogenase I large subunit
MAAVFGGRIPHSTALVPGGVTQVPALERILAYRSRLQKILQFVEFVYIPDLFAVAKEFPQYFDVGRGYGNFLSFGAFPQNDGDDRFIQGGTVIDGQWQSLDQNHILEEVGHSRFSQTPGLHPTQGQTIPAADKTNAYSWIKAPRYRGQPMEVGPLARVMVNYYDPSNTWVKKELDAFLSNAKITPDKMVSVLGRHVARGLEAFWVGKQALVWLDQLEIDGPPTRDFSIPKTGSGFGLTEAPRGALGHWLSIDNHLIKNYQCIVPTTWNCSPRDDQGRPGPVEQAIAGTMVENPQQPIEIGRIVRSFDPCIACAVH